MKKFIAKLLILSVIMSMLIPSTVYADEYSEYIDTQYTSTFEGETEVEYHVYSTYNVTIPVSISQYDSYGMVSVGMTSIEYGYHIEMYITNVDDQGCITVTSGDGSTAKLSVMYNDGLYNVDYTGLFGTFYPADYSAVASTNISLALYDSAKGGVYTGTLCYRIECVQD